MTEELYAFDAEYRARAGVVCGVDEAAAAQPAEAVTAQKRRRIVLAAQGYLLLHPELAENFMRFDVVEVTVPRLGTPRLNCIENAFTL